MSIISPKKRIVAGPIVCDRRLFLAEVGNTVNSCNSVLHVEHFVLVYLTNGMVRRVVSII